MRASTAALQTLIASGLQEWVRADLYTFFQYDGTVLARLTNADRDLTISGNTFISTGPVIERDAMKQSVGLTVDSMTFIISADPSTLLSGVPWLQALRQGALDGGRVTIDRFLSDSWTNVSVGSVKWFSGRVAEVDVGRASARVVLNSDIELLDIDFPRNVYQPSCRFTLYGPGCSLSRSTFSVASSVAAGSTKQSINCGLSQAAGYYDLGILQFTSGPNTGVWRMVRSYTPGVVVLSVPLLNSPTNGDAFTISPGCDKLQATCGATVAIVFTADSTTDVFTSNGHGLQNDQAVMLGTTGALPSPLLTTAQYFVVNRAANTFQLSASIGGAPINLTTNGSGVNSVVAAGKFANILNFGGQPYVPNV